METLDFDYAEQLVPLNGADSNLPSDARLVAQRYGISTLYVLLDGADGNHVTSAVASVAAKIIGDTIADEPLFLFTSCNHEQLHITYPDLSGSRPALRRMVARREQPKRTVVQQIANLWHEYGVLGKPVGEAVRSAFSVQPVTDAFFKDYKDAYDEALAVEQHLDHHLRMVGRSAPPLLLVARGDVRQVQLLYNVGYEVRQMVLRQPLLQRRRQQQLLVRAIGAVNLAHRRLRSLDAGLIIPAIVHQPWYSDGLLASRETNATSARIPRNTTVPAKAYATL